jgi:ABC-type molybdate transport system substrate-binding protein
MKYLQVMLMLCTVVFACSNNQLKENIINKNKNIEYLKWLYLSSNIQGSVRFIDSSKTKVYRSPFECDVALKDSTKISSDTIDYFFFFKDSILNFSFVDSIVYIEGIRVVRKESIPEYYPLVHFSVPSPYNDKKAAYSFFSECRKNYFSLLGNYKGYVAPWQLKLRQELISGK